MIRAGILGAETIVAGELIRILINHPDVDLMTVASESQAGRAVADLHRGLVGDIDMVVESSLNARGHDVVFLCGEPWQATQWMQNHDGEAAEAEMRIIDLTGAFRDGSYNMVYGFPEHNRKPLVRGAKRASVPSAVAMAVEVALFPLAKNGLLVSDITAVVNIAATESFDAVTRQGFDGFEDIGKSTRLDPIAPIENRPDSELASREICASMRAVQQSFTGDVNVRLCRDGAMSRGVIATVNVPCSVALPELERLYADAYEDHNFSYPIDSIPVIADVANTNKCLLNLSYTTLPDSGMPVLQIVTVSDNMLKGSAGTAVHCLNLLFGLSERTGLDLKASAF